ncbi:MAG: HD domain-containing protein [Verrucomicrobia bacterium]|nr:HD domain-containing protein [Verrucomicrobiota bacterium]
MTAISSRGKVFRDPVHGLIRIEPGDEFVLDLINTPEFQRLRRVRQLGLSSLTYPGAEHTRFAHSLGVFNFAQRIIAVLKHRYADAKEVYTLLTGQERILKAAALLHDVGHGPFSHMIERAFEESANHEKKSTALIQDGGAITDCLQHHGFVPKEVANLILKASEHRFLVDIVSSQLDADRMDYILRDALNTGVKYGAFDSEWVVNSLCLGGEPGLNEKPRLQDLRLCLEDKRGLHSAEQLVMARMHMSYQVYYHRVTRGWEAHLLCLLKLAEESAKNDMLPKDTPSNVKAFLRGGDLTGDEWLWFDESAVEAAMHVWAGAQAVNAELAERSRTFLLRQKAFICAELGNLSMEQILRLSVGLNQSGRPNIDWLLDDPKFTTYKDFDSGFRGTKKEQDNAAVSTSAILISDGGLQSIARPAESVSLVLNALGDNPQGNRTSLSRLYYHKKVAESVEKVLAAVAPKRA